MIAGLKPYPEYKTSDEEWLSFLPAHWKKLRGKFLFSEIDERSKTGKEELLSVSHITGITPRSRKTITMFLAQSNIGHKVCHPGDLVINTMWAWMGALAVSKHTGIVSPSYGIYRPRHDCGILSSYTDRLLRTPAYIAEYQRRSTGVNSSRLRLYAEHFLRILIVIPPSEEQVAIVRFLDWANGRLVRTIQAKRKVIALLNEQKQAIIHRAVTRGLDPSVPLKPSGVPWLGDIPQHWDVRRLRQIVFVKPSKSESMEELRHDVVVTFLPMERVKTDSTVDSSLQVPASKVWNGFTYFRRGDVIVAKITPCFENGKGAYLDMLPTMIGFGSTEFHVLRPGPLISGAYLRLVTASKQFLDNGTNSMTGSAGQQRVSTDFIKNYPIALPEIAEQHAILASVGRGASDIESTISRLEREIELLREYRTRLVSDVVTGKLDVREAAGKLPEEAALDSDENSDENEL